MCEALDSNGLSALRGVWKRVFRSNDPFAWPFQPQIATGCIIYPTDGYHLTKRQFMVVREVLDQLGENGFFVSIVESEGQSFLDRGCGHWVCENPSYEEYSQLPLVLENAIYSRNGRWGILVSHEMHAVVGGSTEFMAGFAGRYDEWASDLRLLREAWSGNPNAGWLDHVIARATPL